MRVGCRFWTNFCSRAFSKSILLLNEYILGAASVISRSVIKSQLQVSIFYIKTIQWKSCYVENVCLTNRLDTGILLVQIIPEKNNERKQNFAIKKSLKFEAII